MIPFYTPFYVIVRNIYQLLFYSLIPVLIYLISIEFFNEEKSKIFALLVTILWVINLSFLISSTQYLDIWSITLINLFCFYLLQHAVRLGKLQNYIFLGLGVSTLFFFKPNGIFPYIIILIILWFYKKNSPLIDTKKSIWTFLIILSVILCWAFRNYIYFEKIDFANSSVGYNLWLGNNKYTNGFLVENFGDGSTIEDYIVPSFNNGWALLKYFDEYGKNEFFINEALEFVYDHPLETLENAFWKFVGFWPPLRFRDGHWSDSTTKKLVILFYTIPLLIFSFLSVIKFFIANEYKAKNRKALVIIFTFLWMFPYLFFFSTSRFRIPLDFCLIILSVDFISPYLSKLLKIQLLSSSTVVK